MSSGRTVLVVGNDGFELESLLVLLSQAGEFAAKKAESAPKLRALSPNLKSMSSFATWTRWLRRI